MVRHSTLQPGHGSEKPDVTDPTRKAFKKHRLKIDEIELFDSQ